MKAPRISIALCTYNGARYLLEQLESIEAQTVAPDELVVCDDLSSDHTGDIVRAVQARAPFPIRLHINDQRLGSTKNFDKAIGLCTGDIIALCDQDDIWHRHKLERLKEQFVESAHIGAVFTDAEVVDEALRSTGQTLWNSVRLTQVAQDRIRQGRAFEELIKYNIVTGATLAFRAEYKPLVLPISDLWVHDAWIALLIAAVGRVGVLEEPLVLYRQHEANQIGSIRSRRRRSAGSPAEIFSGRVGRFKQLHERLLSRAAQFRLRRDVLPELKAKIKHLKARGAMPDSRLGRLPLAVRELLTLRYHRYGRGTRSFTSDLFRTVPKADPSVEAKTNAPT